MGADLTSRRIFMCHRVDLRIPGGTKYRISRKPCAPCKPVKCLKELFTFVLRYCYSKVKFLKIKYFGPKII